MIVLEKSLEKILNFESQNLWNPVVLNFSTLVGWAVALHPSICRDNWAVFYSSDAFLLFFLSFQSRCWFLDCILSLSG